MTAPVTGSWGLPACTARVPNACTGDWARGGVSIGCSIIPGDMTIRADEKFRRRREDEMTIEGGKRGGRRLRLLSTTTWMWARWRARRTGCGAEGTRVLLLRGNIWIRILDTERTITTRADKANRTAMGGDGGKQSLRCKVWQTIYSRLKGRHRRNG